MAIILGLHTEEWQSELPQAVAAVNSLTKNVVWQSNSSGGNGAAAEVCWTGSTQTMSVVRPGTVDFFIIGDWPYAISYAAQLMAKWNSAAVTNTFAVNTKLDPVTQDQAVIGMFAQPWGSLYANSEFPGTVLGAGFDTVTSPGTLKFPNLNYPGIVQGVLPS